MGLNCPFSLKGEGVARVNLFLMVMVSAIVSYFFGWISGLALDSLIDWWSHGRSTTG